MEDNRYALLRREFARTHGESHLASVRHTLDRFLSGPAVHFRDRTWEDARSGAVLLPIKGREQVLSALCTVDKRDDGSEREHVSVAVLDLGMTRVSLPSWNQLVMVRALAWPDDVEVHQVLPALTGERAMPWVSVHDVLHLIHRRP